MSDIAVSPRAATKVQPPPPSAAAAAPDGPPPPPAAGPPFVADQSALVPQRGTPSSFTLPGLSATPAAGAAVSRDVASPLVDGAPPAAPSNAVPPYGETFGTKSYVKDGTDPAQLGLMQRAVAAHPELANGPLGQGVQQGNVGPQEVKALQAYLESKGYSVGPKGGDGKFGPDTHAALANMLNGHPPEPAAQPTAAARTSGVAPVADAADDKYTAVFDMRSGRVTLPDGTVLEAHSGRGEHRDNPNSAHLSNTGPTPPGLYRLSRRESLFHGVEALRLNPINGTDAQGRTGLLAHNYMMKRSGDSHGCVVFKNYPDFLNAYKNGQIRQLRVV